MDAPVPDVALGRRCLLPDEASYCWVKKFAWRLPVTIGGGIPSIP